MPGNPRVFSMGAWRRLANFLPRPAMPVLLLAAVSLAAGAVAGRAQQGGTGAPPAEAVRLVAASSNNFPPVNVLDADGGLTGFGRELADAVAEAAGATVTHTHSGVWTEVLDWLDRGEADFIHDAGYTEERTSYLDYTAPILEMPERIFVLADRSDIESFADLAGKKVACVNQHITHLYLKQFPEIDCLIVKRPMEGLYALVEGEAAAFIFPKQIALYLAHNTRLRNRVKMVGEPLRTLTWHMTVKKGNAPLVELLDQGIAKVRANGQYDRIYAKWFGEPLLAGYTRREVILFVGSAIGLSLLAAGTVFALIFAGRMRAARDRLAQTAAERAEAEEALRESEGQVRLLMNSTAEAIYGIDLEGNCSFANPACAEMLGYGSPEDLLGKHMHDLIHHTRRDGTRYPMKECLIHQAFVRGEGAHVEDEVLWRRDGTSFPAEYWSHPVRREGEVVGVVVTFLDITERRRAEQALRNSEARLAGLLDIAPESIISMDTGGRIQLFNQGAEAIFGYRSEEIMGQPLEVLLPPRLRTHHAKFIAGFARAPEASRRMGRRREIAALRKDGTEFPAEGSISKLGVGEEMLFTVVLRDLTEQRRVEESERQLRSHLAHASRLSTVGNMATGLAHEINQPLSAIGTYVQASIRLLRSGKESTEDVIADLERATQQVTRAADIVKWLRGVVAKEETQKTELDLSACIREVTDFLEFEFHTRKCKLVVDLADSLPAVMADKVQIQQVILNLLQNGLEAAEQSARTGCQLKVRTSASSDGTVQVEVEDGGPGIPPEIRRDLFSPFITTKSDGLGFGLSISKSIIEAHGGQIWAVSDAGNGATLAFTLPSAGVDAKAPQDATVFVVDDYEALRDSLHQLFRSAGFDVRTFESGEEFLAAYKPCRVGCLIADVRMPGMSGFDLMEEMTARAIDLPVIMITGDGNAAVERRAWKAGVVAFFQKPVADEVLLDAVKKAIARGPTVSD